MNIGKHALLTDSKDSINGHDQGLFEYVNKRLTFIDESDETSKINTARLKEITSGGNNTQSARQIYSNKTKYFSWTATPFIACNEGQFGKINSADSAFIRRLKIIPFRSLFKNHLNNEEDEFTYKINYKLVNKINTLLDVNFYILLEYYKKYLEFGLPKDPEYSINFKNDLICSNDPLYSSITTYINDNLIFVNDKKEFIKRTDVINNFRMTNDEYNNKRKFSDQKIGSIFTQILQNIGSEFKLVKKINNKYIKNVYINLKYKNLPNPNYTE